MLPLHHDPARAFFGVMRFSRVDIGITSNQFVIRRCFEHRHTVSRNDQPGRHRIAHLRDARAEPDVRAPLCTSIIEPTAAGSCSTQRVSNCEIDGAPHR